MIFEAISHFYIRSISHFGIPPSQKDATLYEHALALVNSAFVIFGGDMDQTKLISYTSPHDEEKVKAIMSYVLNSRIIIRSLREIIAR
jgi:hypothetical protein